MVCSIVIYLWWGERPQVTLVKNYKNRKKTWLSLKGMNKLFKGDLRADLYEANADVVQFTKKWNRKWVV